MRASLAPLVVLVACAQGVERPDEHFDPTSGSLLEDSATVHVINLDDEPMACVTTDGSTPSFDACDNVHDRGGAVDLACGFNVVNLLWGEDQRDTANFQVATPDCEQAGPTTEPVVLWSNDELARAWLDAQDAIMCRMNDCRTPGGTGSWSADCEEGHVDWNVGLNGFRAISTFTYTGCRQTVTIDVHDYATDPLNQDEGALMSLDISLVWDGVLTQDTDFSGNGTEAGVVDISGDFTGKVDDRLEIVRKERGGGHVLAGCSDDPLADEVCAPGHAMIRYDFPDWSCYDDICPVPGEVLVDSDDPDAGDPEPDDPEEPGLAEFYVVQVLAGPRCFFQDSSTVRNSTDCATAEPSYQWRVQDDEGVLTLQNVGNGECLAAVDATLHYDAATAPCDGSSRQQWVLERQELNGLVDSHPVRLKNPATNSCLHADLTNDVYSTWGNCGLGLAVDNRRVGLFPEGDFSAASLDEPQD